MWTSTVGNTMSHLRPRETPHRAAAVDLPIEHQQLHHGHPQRLTEDSFPLFMHYRPIGPE
jgi:hypothetical protein